MNLTIILLIVSGVIGVAAVGEGYLLKRSYEQNGALQTALDTATTRLQQINTAQKERDAIHGTNLALPDDALFDGLLGKAPDKRP